MKRFVFVLVLLWLPLSACSGGSTQSSDPTAGVVAGELPVMDKEVEVKFRAMTAEAFCPCAGMQDQPLSSCLASDQTCPLAWVVADTLAWNLGEGRPEAFAIDMMIQDLKAAQTPQTFTTEGRPRIGSPDAPVELVVFEDFQCPSCKRLSLQIPKVVAHHGSEVTVVFKHFPLAQHKQALPAARAAAAAHLQGKFWEMHDVLFEHQRELSPDLILELAGEVGLDVERLTVDMDSDEIRELVGLDRVEGETADLPGTPTVYINGVDAGPELTSARLIRRVEVELKLAGDTSDTKSAWLTPEEEAEIARFDPRRDRLVAQDGGAPAAEDRYPMLSDVMPLLSEDHQKRFARIAESEICPCEGAFDSLDACLVKEDGSCQLALRLAKVAMRSLLEGESDGAIVDLMTREVQAAKKVHEFSLAKAPYKGADPAKAKLVVVEFADFRCHYCQMAAALTDDLAKKYGDQVTIYYKNFPLNMQSPSVVAARAGYAAGEQGKFWEMHDLMFENQQTLDDEKIVALAKSLDLDMAAFEKRLADDDIKSLVDTDRKEGEDAGISGTPAFYINGVRYLGDLEDLEQTIADKLK